MTVITALVIRANKDGTGFGLVRQMNQNLGEVLEEEGR